MSWLTTFKLACGLKQHAFIMSALANVRHVYCFNYCVGVFFGRVKKRQWHERSKFA